MNDIDIIRLRIADREKAIHTTDDANSVHRLRRLIAKDRMTVAAMEQGRSAR